MQFNKEDIDRYNNILSKADELEYVFEVENKDMRGVAQIIIAKHRNGATCTVNLKFKNEYARFMNEDDERYQTESVIIASNSNKREFINNIPLPSNNNDEVPF